jgi:hypothetical protein
MRKRMDWLQDSDLPVARQWADLEVLRFNIITVLEQDGPMNQKGVPHRLLTELRWITNSQLAYSRDLGMTPASRAEIMANNTNSALDVAGAVAPGEKNSSPFLVSLAFRDRAAAGDKTAAVVRTHRAPAERRIDQTVADGLGHRAPLVGRGCLSAVGLRVRGNRHRIAAGSGALLSFRKSYHDPLGG